jgi:hypothetical protein
MPENNLFWKFNWPAFVWAAFILVLCGFPGDKIPELSFLEWLKPDKIVHLIIFAIQSFLLIRGLQLQNNFLWFKKNATVISLVVTIAYGAFMELLQELIFINRNGDFRDALANAIGAFIGYWYFKKQYLKSVTGH